MLFRDQILEITLHADGQHDLLHAEWPVTRWTHDTVIIVSLIWSLLRLFQDHHQQDQWWSQRILFLSCWTWSDDATLSDDIDWGGWSQLSALMFDWDTMIGVMKSSKYETIINHHQEGRNCVENCPCRQTIIWWKNIVLYLNISQPCICWPRITWSVHLYTRHSQPPLYILRDLGWGGPLNKQSSLIITKEKLVVD